MTKREEIIQYGLTFEDAYVDTPLGEEPDKRKLA